MSGVRRGFQVLGVGQGVGWRGARPFPCRRRARVHRHAHDTRGLLVRYRGPGGGGGGPRMDVRAEPLGVRDRLEERVLPQPHYPEQLLSELEQVDEVALQPRRRGDKVEPDGQEQEAEVQEREEKRKYLGTHPSPPVSRLRPLQNALHRLGKHVGRHLSPGSFWLRETAFLTHPRYSVFGSSYERRKGFWTRNVLATKEPE